LASVGKWLPRMNAATPERKPTSEEISGLIDRVTFHNIVDASADVGESIGHRGFTGSGLTKSSGLCFLGSTGNGGWSALRKSAGQWPEGADGLGRLEGGKKSWGDSPSIFLLFPASGFLILSRGAFSPDWSQL